MVYQNFFDLRRQFNSYRTNEVGVTYKCSSIEVGKNDGLRYSKTYVCVNKYCQIVNSTNFFN